MIDSLGFLPSDSGPFSGLNPVEIGHTNNIGVVCRNAGKIGFAFRHVREDYLRMVFLRRAMTANAAKAPPNSVNVAGSGAPGSKVSSRYRPPMSNPAASVVLTTTLRMF